MRCVFAKGISNQRELSESSSAGSFILSVSNAKDYFNPGDLIFISDADGANLEFLGAATSVTTDKIQCLYALSLGRTTGALCWKPTHFLTWSRKRTMPLTRTLDTGVISRRSAGGVLYLSKVRESSHSELVRFENLRMKQVADFFSWLEEVINGGIEPFTFCDEDRQVSSVALVTTEIVQDETSSESIGLELELARIETGQYV